jgi:hypothetical protein
MKRVGYGHDTCYKTKLDYLGVTLDIAYTGRRPFLLSRSCVDLLEYGHGPWFN